MNLIFSPTSGKGKTLIKKITIGGKIGSGKSTLAKKLSNYYQIPFISAGGLRRYMAHKRGITIQELNSLGEIDPKTDLIPDRYQRTLGASDKDFIFEGKLSWYFIPNSIKIFYDVTEKEAAKRTLKQNRNSEIRANSLEEQIKINQERTKSDISRYKKIYNIDNYFDPKHFDLIIDTTHLNLEQTFLKTLNEINKYNNA